MKKEYRYAKTEILPNGDLRIKLTREGREELKTMQARQQNYQSILCDLFEDAAGNGSYTFVSPEDVGGLTDSPIISDEVSYNDDGKIEVTGNVWWFPNYMVQDEFELMKSKEGWILTKAESETATGVKKSFSIQYNIGKVKYVVNSHDGAQTHKDGSPFFGVATFSNKKKMASYINRLLQSGYVASN